MPIEIRKMTKMDKPAIMHLLKATPEFLPDEVVVAEEVIDAYLTDPDGSGYYTLVAEIDKKIVGYINYGTVPMTKGSWDLYWAAVSRELQGQGIGRQIFTRAEEEIRKANGRMIFIETSSTPQYARARGLYVSMGYQLICQIKDYYIPGDDKVMYQKVLGK